MRIHLIAIGGAAMHNLALALAQNGHHVTGSDDEIYNPAADRLAKFGLLPPAFGWYPEKITTNIEAIILGMHAKADNPELLAAQKLGLKIYSYPEYIYLHAKNKTRIVIAGSHGKTTTTSMIMHVLKNLNIHFDYLVGALLEGFDTMVHLSDAPIMVIEGDEYLSSPIDRQPKILHYHPNIAVITGIAWDHINVFPTFEIYVEQFAKFIQTISTQISQPKTQNGVLIYYAPDPTLSTLANTNPQCKTIPYTAFPSKKTKNKTILITDQNKAIPLQVFGAHNLANLKAAYLVCKQINIPDIDFFSAIQSFTGAAKRLQTLAQTKNAVAFLDFAHAPSKVKATVEALKTQFPRRHLVACLELHTFSSLSKQFLSEYKNTMEKADTAIIYFNEHTLTMKNMPPIAKEEITQAFSHPNLKVFTENTQLTQCLQSIQFKRTNLALMTSGTFGGLNLKELANSLLTPLSVI